MASRSWDRWPSGPKPSSSSSARAPGSTRSRTTSFRPCSADEQWLLDHLPYYLNWDRLIAVFPIGDYRVEDPRDLDIDPEWDEPDTISAQNKRARETLLAYLMDKIGDRPDLVARCIPKYPPMTKRLPKDNGWFDALRKDHACS